MPNSKQNSYCAICGKGVEACDCWMDARRAGMTYLRRGKSIMPHLAKLERDLQRMLESGAMRNELTLVEVAGRPESLRVW